MINALCTQPAIDRLLENRWHRVNRDAWRAALLPRLEPLPPRWQSRLAAQLEKMLSAPVIAPMLSHPKYVAAAQQWGALLDRLQRTRIPLDASDADIIDAADAAAVECARWIERGGREAGFRFCETYGIEPPPIKRCKDEAPALARLRCALWWRRKLRAAHARSVEATAISLGYVHLRGDRYVSDETLARRGQQNRRNARTLESMQAENELGQRFTLAELAARSPANKEIRRGELITRLKGFESIAQQLGHAAEFVTVTCPSRYHAMLKSGERNPRHDRTLTPRDGQQHLSRTWARIRAKLARLRVPVYGFRIAEPHGDGTPHWHFILFCEQQHVETLRAVMRDHALRVDGDEPGAQQHRAKFEAIDRAKGSAVGYVIKYIAKNIDGFRVGDWQIDGDLIGDATLNLSPRIEAWASTWRIRQFQQIGGPPVGLWREMRRIPAERMADAPIEARDAWLAAQRITDPLLTDDDGEPLVLARADFGAFTMACGGPTMPRDARPMRLWRREVEALTRYGEPRPPQPRGLSAIGSRLRNFGGIVGELIVGGAAALVESVRHVWTILREGVREARSADPRTRVNNCTGRRIGASARVALRTSDRGPPAALAGAET